MRHALFLSGILLIPSLGCNEPRPQTVPPATVPAPAPAGDADIHIDAGRPGGVDVKVDVDRAPGGPKVDVDIDRPNGE
ncbi:MAG: hypothetical protein SGJ19_02620 [Planctomycetia bacterium]|nr:hypothetical protein [Planctomycetia bacterium]